MKQILPLATVAIVIFLAGVASAQPAGWCTPGAKLEVFWGSAWYHATVQGPAASGRCQIGYDGWGHGWDEPITMDRAAAAGTKASHSPRPGVVPVPATTVATRPVALAPVQPARAPPAAGGPPLLGLYTCTEPSGYPDMTSMFALLDGSTYSTSEKARGHYRFDPRTDTVAMDSGPLAGKSYQRIPGTHAFLQLHRQMALSCPHSPRDPLRYPW